MRISEAAGGPIPTTNEGFDDLAFAEGILKRGSNKSNHDTEFESLVRIKKNIQKHSQKVCFHSCHFILYKREVFDALYFLSL